MAVRNPTIWTSPSGTGYTTPSTGAAIQTQSLSNLTTQSGTTLNIQPQTYKGRNTTSWNNSSKNKTSWNTPSGTGYVIIVANQYIITNDGKFIVTNSGNFIVTTTTYNKARNLTQWTLSGA